MRRGWLVALAVALLPLPVLAQDIAALATASDAGDVRAQVQMGDLYRTGKGVARDYARAYRYYDLAARRNDPHALTTLGAFYQNGWGVEKNYGLALRYFLAAAEADYPPALNDAGYMYLHGLGVAKNEQQAFQYFRRAAEAGYAPGLNNLAIAYGLGRGVQQDRATAFKYYLAAAQAGNPQAMYNVGLSYEFGRGVAKDYAMAAKYYGQSADLNDAGAQNMLARLYQHGQGVPRNIDRAVDLFIKSAKNGYGAAFFNLGLMLRDGLDGVPINVDQANAAFKEAVKLGYAQAASFIVTAPRPVSPAARDFLPVPDGTTAPLPVRQTGVKVPPGPRLALVIANGAYAPHMSALKNPVNDGKLVAAALAKAGFKVTDRYNLNVLQMKDALASFADALRTAGPNATALFFYAGHGAASEGINYLIPVGQPIKNLTGLQTYGQSADAILNLLDGAKPTTTIVILDACRNVPFGGSRGGEGGLAQMNARNGSIIAYSTAPGKTAEDGEGSDSPYATALAELIRQSDEPVEIVFRRVRARVIGETQNQQTPWESTSLVSDFAFHTH